MVELQQYLWGLAAKLSSSLLVAGGRRVRDEALGNDQERALHAVFGDATAAVLVEIARHDREDRSLPDRLGTEFKKFYEDRWVAEMLVDFAISAEQPPLEELEQRYAAVSNDPAALPMDFGEAMRRLIEEIADRLKKEAMRDESPLANLVQVSQNEIIRKGVEELRRGQKRDREAEAGTKDRNEERNELFEDYWRGPEEAENDVLFAGFFVPEGPQGRLSRSGNSRSMENLFFEAFSDSLGSHRLNTSRPQTAAGEELYVRPVDYRPPPGFAETFDYEDFSVLGKGWAQDCLGVVWGTLSEDGKIERFEVAVDPDKYHGGPIVKWSLERLRRLSEREDVPRQAAVRFLGKALAAVWGQGYCDTLNDEGNWRKALGIAGDSEQLIQEAVEELAREADAGAQGAIEQQRRALLPQVLRQQATSLWGSGQHARGMERLREGLQIEPLWPFGSREKFKDFYNYYYAFQISSSMDDLSSFIAERYGEQAPFEEELAPRFAERAYVGLPSANLELLAEWIHEELAAGEDLEDDIEAWFADLASEHPEDPFVLMYWGEARRIVSVGKYGTNLLEPHAPSLERAAEKFEEAYSKAPDLKVAAFRVAGILRAPAAAVVIEDEDEGARRFAEVTAWYREALPYLEEYMPWVFDDYPRDQATREQMAEFFAHRLGSQSRDDKGSYE